MRRLSTTQASIKLCNTTEISNLLGMPQYKRAIWEVALVWYILQVVTANNHLYDGSGDNEPWWPLNDCYGETCSGNTNFCCDDIQQCCSEIQYHLQIGINNEETTTTTGNECYNTYCGGYKPYCCDVYKTCCNYLQYMLTNPVSHDTTKYRGQKVRCTSSWGGYSMIQCPPDYDHDRLYCCSTGGCCTSAQKSNEDISLKEEPDSGNMGIGATAGFIFMGVIIVATVLTLVTRYIKIKVRRNPSPARMANRDLSNNDSNMPTVQQNLPGMQCPVHRTTPDYHPPQDEDIALPPPTYEEAMSTCPVVSDNPQETAIPPQHTGSRRSGTSDRRSYPPLHRAPSRPVSRLSDCHELRTFSKVTRSRQGRHNKYPGQENNEITLPKPDDSCA